MSRWQPNATLRHALEGAPIQGFKDEANLEKYQLWMADKIINRKGCILAAGMSLGKTAASLYAMTKLLQSGKIKKWLVVAPLNVTVETWPMEMFVWKFAHAYRYSVIHGDDKTRRAAVADSAPFHFVNRENYVWLWQNFRHDWPYDGIIYDEVSRLKSGALHSALKRDPETGQIMSGGNMSEFGALKQGVDAGVFTRRVGLSGTVAPNGLKDLWGPTYLIDKGERLGKSKSAFLDRWFVEERYSREITPRVGALEEITDRLKDVLFVLESNDYLIEHLPDTVMHECWVDLPDKAMTEYRRLQKKLVLEEYDVEAVSNGVLANKLLQLSNGSLYDKGALARPIHDRKLEELEAIYHNAAGAPLLVSYSYQFDKERIKRRFPHFRVFGDSPDDVADWNAGKIGVMLLHCASAGHGLNLQFGGNTIVWYGLTWSLELFQQLNARLARRGQNEKRIHVYMILARGTYDERQLEVLLGKETGQQAIKNLLRITPTHVAIDQT